MAYNPKVIDLNLSIHTYETNLHTFIFSSLFNKERFALLINSNRTKITHSISARYGIPVMMNSFCDFNLYTQIERRGFRVIINESGVEIKWQREVTFVGELKMQIT